MYNVLKSLIFYCEDIMIAKPLQFEKQTLSPYMSVSTLDYHYNKHYIGYVNRVNKLTSGTEFENKSVYEICEKSTNSSLVHNAKQVLNHEFFWRSLGKIDQEISRSLSIKFIENFGSVQNFKDEFFTNAMEHYGSGWVWLCLNSKNELEIKVTRDTDTLLLGDSPLKPLLVLDIWEHTYYLDYHNEKSTFTKVFLDHLANWEFLEDNIKNFGN